MRWATVHEWVCRVVCIAIMVNVFFFQAEDGIRDIPEAARAMGLQIQVLNASTSREIEAAFATLVRDRADALYIAGDVFFTSRRVQFATLAASYRIPASYASRESVEAGGRTGYDTRPAGTHRHSGPSTPPSPCRRARHSCAAHRTVALGAARPAIRCRNRPGGGSNIGIEAVVRASPDGYTLLSASTANTINATLYDRLNFDFISDIAPVA